jgi:uncharacterized protein YjbJ (UPF0337 family)
MSRPTRTGSDFMTQFTIKGDWKAIAAKLKQKWSQLTDDDLKYVAGQQEALIGRIQKRTGQSRNAVEKVVRDLCFGR